MKISINKDTQSRPINLRGHQQAKQKPKDFKLGFKYVCSFIKPYWYGILICLVFSIFASILTVLAPTYLEQLVNLIVNTYVNPLTANANEWVSILIAALYLLVFYLSSFLCQLVNSLIMAVVSQKTGKRTREKIIAKVDRMPLAYFDAHQIGDSLSLVTNDTDALIQAIANSFSTVISSTVSIVALSVIMFMKNWILALICVGAVPINILIIGVFMTNAQRVFTKQAKTLAMLNGNIEEIYTAHNIVKVFNAQESSYEQFAKKNNNLYKVSCASQILNAIMMPVMFIITNICQALIISVGVVLCVSNRADLGLVIAFISYFHIFNNSFSQIAQQLGQVLTCTAAAERIGEFLTSPEIKEEGKITKTIEASKLQGNISFKKIKFGYEPKRIIINDFSLDVKKGQKIAIVGPTGAGKTTIVNLLMRFYDLNKGTITIDGVDFHQIAAKNVRALFAMILQDTWLFTGTIYENIVFNKPNVKKEEVICACKEANVDHFIQSLPKGYDTLISENSNISAGERQLLTIARAILQDAPMLILDEATSSVDTRTEELIQRSMDNLMKNRTSFIIAHRLSTIKNADVIIVLKDGDIIECGNHKTLLAKNGFYAKLYNSQFSL